MPKFYCLHYTEKCRIPKLTPEQAADLEKAIAETRTKMPAVEFNRIMWDPNTSIGVIDVDAPDAKAVEEFLKAIYAPPCDVIVPVEEFRPQPPL